MSFYCLHLSLACRKLSAGRQSARDVPPRARWPSRKRTGKPVRNGSGKPACSLFSDGARCWLAQRRRFVRSVNHDARSATLVVHPVWTHGATTEKKGRRHGLAGKETAVCGATSFLVI
ncbi:unnamed protein product [Ixodes persulcatus]